MSTNEGKGFLTRLGEWFASLTRKAAPAAANATRRNNTRMPNANMRMRMPPAVPINNVTGNVNGNVNGKVNVKNEETYFKPPVSSVAPVVQAQPMTGGRRRRRRNRTKRRRN